MKNGNRLETNTDTKPETIQENTECNGDDGETSSGTLELTSTEASDLLTTQTTAGSEKTNSDQHDSSVSTMSSDAGTPNLSLSDVSGLKETLSDSYVKLPN